MIRRPRTLAAFALLSLALAGCQGDQPEQDARAVGEVLPGSVSDAMIPHDTVRSQPPLAPPPTGGAKGSPGKGRDSDEAEAAGTESAAQAEDAPAIAIPPATAAAE